LTQVPEVPPLVVALSAHSLIVASAQGAAHELETFDQVPLSHE
jgi:hypothetical protein